MARTSTTTEQRTPWWRGPRVAVGVVAATAVAVVAVFAIVTLADSDKPFDAGEALSVTDAYFEAYNAGDVEAVIALFEPEVVSSGDFGEANLVWATAQGTILSPPDCTATEELSGVSVTVSCSYFNLDALVQAVDGPPVPITQTLTVTPDGIREEVSVLGSPTFNYVAFPFRAWMARNHPEDAGKVGFGSWRSVEEAEQNGILTALYAQEWAVYLEENGCRYDDGC